MIPFGLPPDLKALLASCRTIAIVGLSPKPERPSHQVAQYLLQAGYRIIPVNPGQTSILGQPCFPTLADIQEQIDIVDIFRRAEDVVPVVTAAVAIRARLIWMQEGIVNQPAAELARQAGLTVIMDRCLKKDHQALLG